MQNMIPIISEPDPKEYLQRGDLLSFTSSNFDMVLVNGKIHALIPLTYKALQNEPTELKVSENE